MLTDKLLDDVEDLIMMLVVSAEVQSYFVVVEYMAECLSLSA